MFSTDGHSYGHPAQETIKRYNAYDKNILAYRTDKNGNISLYANGSKWWFDKSDVGKKIGSYLTGTTQPPSTGSVFIIATGTKYHFVSTCPGLSNANSIFSVTLSEALSRGLTLCGYED